MTTNNWEYGWEHFSSKEAFSSYLLSMKNLSFNKNITNLITKFVTPFFLKCEDCGAEEDIEIEFGKTHEFYGWNGEPLCECCYDERIGVCCKCKEKVSKEDFVDEGGCVPCQSNISCGKFICTDRCLRRSLDQRGFCWDCEKAISAPRRESRSSSNSRERDYW